MTSSTDLRPRTIGEILDAAFALYRRRFWSLLLVSTLLSLPCLVASVISAAPTGRAQASAVDIMRSVLDDVGKHDRKAQERMLRNAEKMKTISSGELFFHTVVAALFQSLARATVLVAMALATWGVISRGEIPGVWGLVRASLARSPPAAIVQIALSGGLLIAGFLELGALPWFGAMFVIGTYLATAGAVLALERGPAETRLRAWAGPSFLRRAAAWLPLLAVTTVAICRRSFAIAGTLWSFARASVLVFVVYTMLSVFVGVISAIVFGVTGSFGGMWVAQHWAEAAFLPVMGGALAIWYLDLRIRREGLDIRAAIDGMPA